MFLNVFEGPNGRCIGTFPVRCNKVLGHKVGTCEHCDYIRGEKSFRKTNRSFAKTLDDLPPFCDVYHIASRQSSEIFSEKEKIITRESILMVN